MTDLYIPDPVVLEYDELPMAIAQYSGLIGQLASRLIIERRHPEAVEDDTLLTAKEAARLLSCSPSFLYQRVKTLPFVKHIGHKTLFSKHGIQSWLAKRK
jgi:excisionase family DNA binding protein